MTIRAYTGDTRAKKTKKKLADAQIGHLVVRGRLKIPEGPWAFDNGVFADFKAGETWTDEKELGWLCDVREIARLSQKRRPDFIALPDAVGDSERTVRLAAWGIHRMRATGLLAAKLSLAYVVQDGMSPKPRDGMAQILGAHKADGLTTIFVGGSKEWKWETAPAWSRLAHSLGLRCHVGRVGSAVAVERAAAAGVDSIDSCVPLWSDDNLRIWLDAIARAHAQLQLFSPDNNTGTTTDAP